MKSAVQLTLELDCDTSPTKTSRLAKKHGGKALKITTYCLFWVQRPPHIGQQCLCTGGDYWEQCPDFKRCLQNKPVPRKKFLAPRKDQDWYGTKTNRPTAQRIYSGRDIY